MARPGNPDIPPASTRGRLARLIPGRRGGTGTGGYESAERQAVIDATLADDIPIVPAPLGRPRPKPAATATPATPPAATETAALASTEAASPSAALATTATAPPEASAEATPPAPPAATAPPGPEAAFTLPAAPTAPAPAVASAPVPAPAVAIAPPETGPEVDAVAAIAPPAARGEIKAEPLLGPGDAPQPSSWARVEIAVPPRTIPMPQAATPTLAPPPGEVGRHWREPGETAPEELLQAPPSVGAAADDFFGGLVRRVEGDR